MKSHFQVLDGLRGTAAFSVLMFHILELTTADPAHNPMRYSFLAVDFFFVLSGFVVGHAYDGRMSPAARVPLTFRDFVKRRLIRLHPMVVAAMVIAVPVYILDPFVENAPRVGVTLSWLSMTAIFTLSLFLLPTPQLPDTFGETHSLDGPSWTLFQEYIANLLFGLFGQKLNVAVHCLLYGASAVALVAAALHFGDLNHGWGWTDFWVAPIRLACSFLMGLLISQRGWRSPLQMPGAFTLLSLALLAVFFAPYMGAFNGLFEAFCIIVVFPLVLLGGTGVHELTGLQGKVCRFLGDLSYPLYIIHYPFLYVFAHWNWSTQPGPRRLWIVAAALYLSIVALAYALMRWYDKPVRAWLTRVCLEPHQPGAGAPAPVLLDALPDARDLP